MTTKRCKRVRATLKPGSALALCAEHEARNHGDSVTEELPNEVLLELGHLVWAAINLEDVVYSVCHSVKPHREPYHGAAIGQRIDDALKDLKDHPDNELRATADAWLVEAKAALRDRNSVLHSVAVTFEPLAPDITQGNTEPMLTHMPKNRARSVVHTPLTVEGFQPIRARLAMARIGWDQLASAQLRQVSHARGRSTDTRFGGYRVGYRELRTR